jgi:hypothetical protein
MASFSVLLFVSFPLLPFNKRKRFYALFGFKNKMGKKKDLIESDEQNGYAFQASFGKLNE